MQKSKVQIVTFIQLMHCFYMFVICCTSWWHFTCLFRTRYTY